MVTRDVIVYSFKSCRISSSTGGSDDGFIYYLNDGGVAHTAVETIAMETIGLTSRDGDGDDDCFASDSEAEFEADLHIRRTG